MDPVQALAEMERMKAEMAKFFQDGIAAIEKKQAEFEINQAHFNELQAEQQRHAAVTFDIQNRRAQRLSGNAWTRGL